MSNFNSVNMKKIVLLFVFILLQCCQTSIVEPQLGHYRAEMITKDGSILPFKFEFIKDSDQLLMKIYSIVMSRLILIVDILGHLMDQKGF